MYFLGTSVILALLMNVGFLPPEFFELAIIAYSLTVIMIAKGKLRLFARKQAREIKKAENEYQERFNKSFATPAWAGHAKKLGSTVLGHATGTVWGVSAGNMALEIGADLFGRPGDPEKEALQAKLKALRAMGRWEYTKFWAFVFAHFGLLYALYVVLGFRTG